MKSRTAYACSWLMVLLMGPSLFATDRDARLLDAAKQRDTHAVRALLKQGAAVDAREPDGSTALAWASYHDDLEAANLLIAAGADVNAANDYGETPLSLACQTRNPALVEKLLSAGANPNAAKRSGETVLMTATRTGSVVVVKLLIAHGADVNRTEMIKGQTALMWAVARKHRPVAEALIAAGANVNAAAKSGSTPLHFAIQESDVAAANILLSAGATPNAMMTVRQIDQEVQPFVETFDGMTPLLLAIAICRASAPELTRTTNRTSSPYACNVKEELGTILLDHGADPNAGDSSGVPALHAAVHARMVNLVKALVAHGANPNVRVSKTARQWEGEELVGGRGFFPLPVGATPFFVAARIRHVELMRALLATGADPQMATDEKTTPLMAVAGIGARPGRNERDKMSDADSQNMIEAAKLALARGGGGDVNAVNASGQTALHGAAALGSNELIQYLVEQGAKVDVTDNNGQTPLVLAQRRKAQSTIDLLTRLSGRALPLPTPQVR